MKITLNEQECEGIYNFCKAGTYAATVGFASTFGDDATKVFTDAVNLVHEKYGRRFGDAIEHTVVFPDGIQAVIRLVIGTEEDYPYTEGVLLDADDNELSRTEPGNKYVCLWMLDHNDTTYFVDITYPEAAMKEKPWKWLKISCQSTAATIWETLRSTK